MFKPIDSRDGQVLSGRIFLNKITMTPSMTPSLFNGVKVYSSSTM